MNLEEKDIFWEMKDIFWDVFILLDYIASEMDVPYMKEPLKNRVAILRKKLENLENL